MISIHDCAFVKNELNSSTKTKEKLTRDWLTDGTFNRQLMGTDFDESFKKLLSQSEILSEFHKVSTYEYRLSENKQLPMWLARMTFENPKGETFSYLPHTCTKISGSQFSSITLVEFKNALLETINGGGEIVYTCPEYQLPYAQKFIQFLKKN